MYLRFGVLTGSFFRESLLTLIYQATSGIPILPQAGFRGAQMVYGEAEYRYKILNNGLLGGVFFLNAESLSAAPGTKLQGIQPGFGPGLRIKLNKISKTNICVDYGFGRQGSNGLFIDVGEIF